MLMLENKDILSLNCLEDFNSAFPVDADCINFLELHRWNGAPHSPYNHSSKIYVCGNGKYKCKAAQRYFTVKTNTIFDGTKIPLQIWFFAIVIYLNNNKDFKLSLSCLERDLDLTPRSVWLLLYKIRYALNHTNYKSFMKKNHSTNYFNDIVKGILTVPQKRQK